MDQPRNKASRQQRAPRPADSKRAPSAPADSRAPAADTPADTQLRSEGQRLMQAVPASLAEVAAAVGCKSRQTVSDWRSGKKAPAPEMRAKLYEVYKIPVDAWESDARRPGAALAPPSPPHGEPIGVGPTTLEDCKMMLQQIQTELGKPMLAAEQRLKYFDQKTKVLALKHRLERDAELLEDRIIREHPTWHRMQRAMINALVPFPQAARAVADALAAALTASP